MLIFITMMSQLSTGSVRGSGSISSSSIHGNSCMSIINSSDSAWFVQGLSKLRSLPTVVLTVPVEWTSLKISAPKINGILIIVRPEHHSLRKIK